jgi:hypothetical protein
VAGRTGDVTLAIADISGLQTALDGKAPTSHSHAISDVTNLQTTLDGKASVTHSHAISDVTGLQTALDGKEPSLTAASQIEMETGTEAALRSMSPLRVAQAIAALQDGPLTRAITFGSVGAAADGTIVLMGYAPWAGTINSLKNLQTSTGTITAAVQIGGVNVTGLSSLSVTSTPQSPNASGANTFAIGDVITVVLSSNSSAADLQGCLQITPG